MGFLPRLQDLPGWPQPRLLGMIGTARHPTTSFARGCRVTPLEDSWLPECNRTVILSRNQPKASVTSPGFPRQYPDNANCDIDIIASAGYKIILDFEELVLEDEPSCSYDYLMILEVRSNDSTSFNESVASKRLCGDWSSKLKLLRHVSSGSRLRLRFSSDYSHHFGGFKARVSMENVMQCSDDQFFLYNNSCYLIVSYPEVTWNTSEQICEATKANLASVLSAEEERFIISTIRRTTDYRTSALYWRTLLARSQVFFMVRWKSSDVLRLATGHLCKIQKRRGLVSGCPVGSFASFLFIIKCSLENTNYVANEKFTQVRRFVNFCGCDLNLPTTTFVLNTRGYVCKKPHHAAGLSANHNRTVNGTEGRITTPNYPGRYYHNLDFWVKVPHNSEISRNRRRIPARVPLRLRRAQNLASG
ncbi:unnamed protein product [Acanthoscelides obtectus]|uniref:Uncharacterized protein n=1 Tax=Acanthoscelides obtectus TaxID=200917 RepID=A0A9P0Q967_ACAOB|nr:unnamed protein product [Acanthoscelides obtectus]